MGSSRQAVNKNTPVKTEYLGVVFDSKSEAIFARTLHLAGHEVVYHPASHCGHEWDFLVFLNLATFDAQSVKIGGRYYFRRNMSIIRRPPVLVEYKPSRPTKQYVDNLTEKTREEPFESVLVWGNPWDGPPDMNCCDPCSYVCYPIFSSFGKYGWGDFCPMADSGEPDSLFSNRHEIADVLGIYEHLVDEAKRFRFDLEYSSQGEVLNF